MRYEYIGKELELFSHAHNWKKYFSSFIKPYLRGNVLEVGSGIGGTTKVLYADKVDKWTCLEPDPRLCRVIEQEIQNGNLPDRCEVITGTVKNLPGDSSFNCATYIDVLEHIENDTEEIRTVVKYIKQSGYLIILSPAYQFLYSNFDKEIGHFRRYTRDTLINIIPSNLKPVSIKYLDSVSVLTNLLNKLLLKQEIPTINQIKIWDRTLVPISRIIDPLFRYSAGKSILGIWEKD